MLSPVVANVYEIQIICGSGAKEMRWFNSGRIKCEMKKNIRCKKNMLLPEIVMMILEDIGVKYSWVNCSEV